MKGPFPVLGGISLLGLAAVMLWALWQDQVADAEALAQRQALFDSFRRDPTPGHSKGRPILLKGELTTAEGLKDPWSGASCDCLLLERRVERWERWIETSTTIIQNAPKEYRSTRTGWREPFAQWEELPAGELPESMLRAGPWRAEAPRAWIDGREVPPGLLAPIAAPQPMPISRALPESLALEGVTVENDTYVVYSQDESRQVGDVRVSYRWVPVGPVTLLAWEDGERIGAGPAGRWVRRGLHDPQTSVGLSSVIDRPGFWKEQLRPTFRVYPWVLIAWVLLLQSHPFVPLELGPGRLLCVVYAIYGALGVTAWAATAWQMGLAYGGLVVVAGAGFVGARWVSRRLS